MAKKKLDKVEETGLRIAHLLMSEGWDPAMVVDITPALVAVLRAGAERKQETK